MNHSIEKSNCPSIMLIVSVSIFVALLAATLLAETLSLPIAEGNKWVYSYLTDNSSEMLHRVNASSNSSGTVTITMDSVRHSALSTDTSFFRLVIIDSGTTRQWDTVYSNYRITYNLHYHVYKDTTVTGDTAFSPGFNKILVNFDKMNDTAYNISFGSVSRKTTSISIILGTNHFPGFSTIFNSSSAHASPSGGSGNSADDTTNWAPEIGLILNKHNDDENDSYGNGSWHSLQYSLISFNGASFRGVPVRNGITTQHTDHKAQQVCQYRTFLNKSAASSRGFYLQQCFNLNGRRETKPLSPSCYAAKMQAGTNTWGKNFTLIR